MRIDQCTKADFDYILAHLEEFWGSDRTRHIHHPTIIHQFGNSAFVVRDGDRLAAYLFGFLAQNGPVGYVHAIATHRDYRGRGCGKMLYDTFIAYARAYGCTAIEAITRPFNKESIAFHTRIGMTLLGEPNADGVPVVRDYAGPGEDRVVFHMALPQVGPSAGADVVELRPITVENLDEAVELNVSDDQVNFVASNAYSIAESKFHPLWSPMAIYAAGEMVGFIMWGADGVGNRGEWWIIRLMIDARFQGKGYGKAATLEAMRLLHDKGCQEIYLSFEPENVHAERLYRALGFHDTGRIEHGEIVYVYEYKEGSPDA